MKTNCRIFSKFKILHNSFNIKKSFYHLVPTWALTLQLSDHFLESPSKRWACLTSRDCQSEGTSRIAKPCPAVVHAEILWADFKRENRKIRSKLGQLILARIFSIKPRGTRRGVEFCETWCRVSFPASHKDSGPGRQRAQEPPPFCPALLNSGKTLFLPFRETCVV